MGCPFLHPKVTRNHVVGLDFNSGTLSHSIRFGYLKADRNIADGSNGSGLLLSNYPLNIQMGFTGLMTGPRPMRPSSFDRAIIRANTTAARSQAPISSATVSTSTVSMPRPLCLLAALHPLS